MSKKNHKETNKKKYKVSKKQKCKKQRRKTAIKSRDISVNERQKQKKRTQQNVFPGKRERSNKSIAFKVNERNPN